MTRTPARFPIHRVLAGILAALLSGPACALPGTGLAAQDARPMSPTEVLDSVLSSPPLSRAHWGVAVYDTGGTPVLRHNTERLFTAASTLKLVTAAAALDLLGPDHRFETVIEAAMEEEGRASRIVIRGSGDPTLNGAFHPHPLAALDSMADSLRAAGVRRLTGPIVVDQGRFDSTLTHPAWETFDLDWYYAAPVAPLAVMSGAYEVIVTPAAVGAPARVRLPHAAALVGVDADIRTAPGGEDWDDVLRRLPGDSLVLRGTIGVEAGPDTSWIAQTDPGRTAGRALHHALERAGIEGGGRVDVRYRGVEPAPAAPHDGGNDADAGPVERGAEGVTRVVWRSPPLAAIIERALKESDNWAIEQVLKGLAAALRGRGDWTGGTDLVEEYLTGTVGVPSDAYYLRDGSGLTAQGLLTPDAVVAVLRHATRRPWGTAFRAALARPGEPESTLEDRLVGLDAGIAAKTGTLRHVNALSGYLRTADGRALVFSILSNGSGQPSWRVQAAIDRIVESLVESGS